MAGLLRGDCMAAPAGAQDQKGGIWMFTWILENMATIAVTAVLALLVAAVIAGMVRSRKKGGSSCGCGCAGCAMGSVCHSRKDRDGKDRDGKDRDGKDRDGTGEPSE